MILNFDKILLIAALEIEAQRMMNNKLEQQTKQQEAAQRALFFALVCRGASGSDALAAGAVVEDTARVAGSENA